MDRPIGATSPAVWGIHADAGRTTFTVGIPGASQTAFLDRGAAVAHAAEERLPLFRWAGRTGHQIEVPEMEMG